MNYFIFSCTHKTSSIEERERAFALFNEEYIKSIKKDKEIKEFMYVATCNRVEIIISTENLSSVKNKVKEHFKNTGGVCYIGDEAIKHIFSVASGLDSLVLGETQIVGQLKEAFSLAYENSNAKEDVSRLMHFAFKCSAEIKNRTDVSKNKLSLSSVAVDALKDMVGGEQKVLIIGCGNVSKLVIRHVLKKTRHKVTVINRDKEKPLEYKRVKNVDIEVADFKELEKEINKNDIIFSATSKLGFVIDKLIYIKEPKIFMDLAMPRDIDVDEEKHTIMRVDDFKKTSDKNMAIKEESLKHAQDLIEEYVLHFKDWLSSMSVDPIIKHIKESSKNISREEIKRAISKGYLKEEDEKSIEKLLHTSFSKFLHPIIVKLRDMHNPGGDMVIESSKILFGYEHKERKFIDKYKCEQYTTESKKEEDEI